MSGQWRGPMARDERHNILPAWWGRPSACCGLSGRHSRAMGPRHTLARVPGHDGAGAFACSRRPSSALAAASRSRRSSGERSPCAQTYRTASGSERTRSSCVRSALNWAFVVLSSVLACGSCPASAQERARPVDPAAWGREFPIQYDMWRRPSRVDPKWTEKRGHAFSLKDRDEAGPEGDPRWAVVMAGRPKLRPGPAGCR